LSLSILLMLNTPARTLPPPWPSPARSKSSHPDSPPRASG
jgi:hypothetical protein